MVPEKVELSAVADVPPTFSVLPLLMTAVPPVVSPVGLRSERMVVSKPLRSNVPPLRIVTELLGLIFWRLPLPTGWPVEPSLKVPALMTVPPVQGPSRRCP